MAKIEELTESKIKLKEELATTNATMGNMIAEFGNMFGGGADHELAKYEVAKKVGVKSEDINDDTNPT